MKWMDRERSFWVIGGDLRQRALARLLREDGHTVHIAGLEGEGLEPEPLALGWRWRTASFYPCRWRWGRALYTPHSAPLVCRWPRCWTACGPASWSAAV